MQPQYIHLRQHTEYSITDGLVRVDEAVSKALELDMPALGFTDLSNAFGWIKAYRSARSKGIKPVFGCDVWISNEADRNRPGRALLLVQHREGYRRLCELLTRAYRDNLYRGRAEIDPAWFLEGTEGLLALSGGLLSGVVQSLQAGNMMAARKQAEFWSRAFPDRYYLELQRYGLPETERIIDGLLEIGAEFGIPSVATHPIQFLNAGDFKAHEARVCIAEGYLLADQRRPRHFTEQQYFKSPAEMWELFADMPQALENSVAIAKRCNLVLDLGKTQLPRFPTPNDVGLDEYLRESAAAGLARRLAHRTSPPVRHTKSSVPIRSVGTLPPPAGQTA